MSSILRALKKVQNESSGRYEFLPWPSQIHAEEKLSKRLKSFVFNKFFLFSCLVLVISVGIGWHEFNKKEELIGKTSNSSGLYSDPVYDVKKAVPKPEAFELPAENISEGRMKNDVGGQTDSKHYESEKKTPETEKVPVKTPVRNPGQNIMELNDPDITLQAIVWASDPQDRVAVINGGFIGEGGIVGEFRVTAIMRADVLLRDNDNEEWRLTYRQN